MKQWALKFFVGFSMALLPFMVTCGRQALGPRDVFAVVPASDGGNSCLHTVQRVRLETLSDISTMEGEVGKVVAYTNGTLDLENEREKLEQFEGFETLSLHFNEAEGALVPQDVDTLFASSLYYGIERAHLLFKSLDPAADLSQVLDDFSETRIVHNLDAIRERNGELVPFTDNASYVQRSFVENEQLHIRNFFLSYLTEENENIPLGANLGILAHEFTHMVFFHLNTLERAKRGISHANESSDLTGRAINEGLADYFGFLVARNPGYVVCSLPKREFRDISIRKSATFAREVFEELTQTTDANQSVAEGFAHAGGSIFAAIQYEIGEEVGHEEHARSLIRLMQALPGCNVTNDKQELSFETVRQCHLSVLGSRQSVANRVYDAHFHGFNFGGN